MARARWIGLLGVACLLAGLLGCEERTCGTSRYWVGGADYVTALEPCDAFGGSYGRHFPNAPFTQLYLSPDAGEVSAVTGFILDFTPGAGVVFRTDHLRAREVMDMQHLAGFGFHDPTGSGAFPSEQPLTFGVLEVLDGPRQRNDQDEFRLRWNLTMGDLAEPHLGGFQNHVGEAWVSFDTGVVPWDDTLAPPDAE